VNISLPKLSAVERKVLEALPKDLSQLNFGQANSVATWGVVAGAAVFVFVVVAGVYLARAALRQVEQQKQQQGVEVLKLSPAEQDQSGDLTRFIDEAALAGELEGLDARTAVQTLVTEGRIG
jgi:hypothetical protein